MDPSSPSPLRSAWLERVPDWARRPGALAAVAAVAALAIVAVVFVLRAPAGPPASLALPRADAGTVASASPAAPGASAPPSTGGMVTVHAAGAVASPGVYALPAAARVADVLVAAGGSLPDADLDRINLATRLNDGDRVYVPRRGEVMPTGVAGAEGGGASTAGSSTTAAGPIDLNGATVEQLDTLPGIGPATAQAIVSYRNRHGRFRSVTELLEVPGIGPSKLEAIRTLVRV